MADPPPPRPASGLTLYADLLEPENSPSSATIVAAPVLYSEQAATKRAFDAALRFQHVRRPVAAGSRAKPRVFPFPKAASAPSASSNLGTASNAQAGTANNNATAGPDAKATTPQAAKSMLDEWTQDDDDEWLSRDLQHPRRNKRRKKRKGDGDGDGDGRVRTDWNEIYDPARPTNLEEYLMSDERIWEVREWKQLLYRRRDRDDRHGSADEDDGYGSGTERRPANMFAPPESYASVLPPPPPPPPPPPESPPATVPDDATGDDALARRLAVSQGMHAVPPLPESPRPSVDDDGDVIVDAPVPPPPPPSPPAEDPRPGYSATITRAPVLYAQPEPTRGREQEEEEEEEEEENEDMFRPGLGGAPAAEEPEAAPAAPAAGEATEPGSAPDGDAPPRSNRPGQAGFAQRLLGKYGWTKGMGLGADKSGIVNPLQFKVEKRKRRPGGGWGEPVGGKGRIVGGRKKPPAGEGGGEGGSADDGFGKMSEVVILRGMLDGMEDLEDEVEQGLGQEIGEECGEKYGRVQRLYIDTVNRQVFIKFTEQISALRAVNELNGRIFNGNAIVSKFYDTDKFEDGIYT